MMMNSQKGFGLDLSNDLENVPVLIEKPSRVEYPVFQYSPDNVPGPGCPTDPSEVTLPGCSCHVHSCPTDSCSCLQAYGQTYNASGRLLDPSPDSDPPHCRPVFECNALCGCSEACSNRVVQRGLGLKLEVFPTEGRGWGVRTPERVPRGTFVCEYAGEVIGFEEAGRRQRAQAAGDCNYIIAVREHAGGGRGKVTETFVDPAVTGNVGRFLNHSCRPSLFMVPVRVHSAVPRLALFAGRDIEAREELTFDYAGGYRNQPPPAERSAQGDREAGQTPTSPLVEQLTQASQTATGPLQRKPCRCGAQNCTGVLPLDVSVLSV